MPKKKAIKKPIKILVALIVLVAAGLLVKVVFAQHDTDKNVAAVKTTTQSKSQTAEAPAKAATNYCADNVSGQLIIVSISRQHLYACNANTTVYDNPVITGMQMYPSELTPVGTYHVYAKSTGQTLAGSDFTGKWSDYVNYWMPFLDNQYGTYGFHDLTDTDNGAAGRADSDFGNVDINAPYTAAKHGSHGCVEMPLAAMKWLYNWAPVGATLTVEA